jgi:hypothetical protein
VIACPKCGAELEVPRTESLPTEVSGAGDPGGGDRGRAATTSTTTSPSLFEDIAAAIPEDLAGLRPEDIRVEAAFADLIITTEEPATPATARSMAPTAEDPGSSSDAQAVLPDAEAPFPILTGGAVPATASDPSTPDGVLPEISIEPPTILPRDHQVRHVREVVLQPATVLAWSLLVLLAVPLAFVAGLLMGHYVWK